MNSSVDIYKQEIELSRLNDAKLTTQNDINSELNDLSRKSTESVSRSKSIIKKTKHETPKIMDTTDYHMLQYINDFRPKQD